MGAGLYNDDRRWGGVDGLLVDAVDAFAGDAANVPETGDIDHDLQLWAHSILEMLTGPVSGALVRALFGGAGDSPYVRALRQRFWTTRVTLVRPMVERAISRGQLPAGTDVDEVIRHVGAPLYYRLLVLDQPLSAEAADLAAAVTAAAAQAGASYRQHSVLGSRDPSAAAVGSGYGSSPSRRRSAPTGNAGAPLESSRRVVAPRRRVQARHRPIQLFQHRDEVIAPRTDRCQGGTNELSTGGRA